MGVPSVAMHVGGHRTVSVVHGRPSSAASVARARTGVAATPPSPIRALTTTPSRTSRAMAAATLEMSSNRRLAILWKW